MNWQALANFIKMHEHRPPVWMEAFYQADNSQDFAQKLDQAIRGSAPMDVQQTGVLLLRMYQEIYPHYEYLQRTGMNRSDPRFSNLEDSVKFLEAMLDFFEPYINAINNGY